ncbi:MAG: hypothetical protein HC900_03385 [Methylacidiphilales bacterium]|nr:hypothetical protein [Candidatus Methylacidiphilales bacterium]
MFTVTDGTTMVSLPDLRAAVRWFQSETACTEDEVTQAARLFLGKALREVEIELSSLLRRRGRWRKPRVLKMPATKVALWDFILALPAKTGGPEDVHLAVLRIFLEMSMGRVCIASAKDDDPYAPSVDSVAADILDDTQTPETKECPSAANLTNPGGIEGGEVEEGEATGSADRSVQPAAPKSSKRKRTSR